MGNSIFPTHRPGPPTRPGINGSLHGYKPVPIQNSVHGLRIREPRSTIWLPARRVADGVADAHEQA